MGISRFVLVAAFLTACASANTDTDKPARPASEVVSGGARLRGGGFRMDVQIGRPFSQRTTRNATVTAKPAAVVTP